MKVTAKTPSASEFEAMQVAVSHESRKMIANSISSEYVYIGKTMKVYVQHLITIG